MFNSNTEENFLSSHSSSLLGESSSNLDVSSSSSHSRRQYPEYHIRTHPSLKYVAFSGLFGSSCPVKEFVPDLAEKILNNYDSLDRWEDIATPIIRTFLRRLVYEGSFSFVDRVNE